MNNNINELLYYVSLSPKLFSEDLKELKGYKFKCIEDDLVRVPDNTNSKGSLEASILFGNNLSCLLNEMSETLVQTVELLKKKKINNNKGTKVLTDFRGKRFIPLTVFVFDGSRKTKNIKKATLENVVRFKVYGVVEPVKDSKIKLNILIDSLYFDNFDLLLSLQKDWLETRNAYEEHIETVAKLQKSQGSQHSNNIVSRQPVYLNKENTGFKIPLIDNIIPTLTQRVCYQ